MSENGHDGAAVDARSGAMIGTGDSAAMAALDEATEDAIDWVDVDFEDPAWKAWIEANPNPNFDIANWNDFDPAPQTVKTGLNGTRVTVPPQRSVAQLSSAVGNRISTCDNNRIDDTWGLPKKSRLRLVSKDPSSGHLSHQISILSKNCLPLDERQDHSCRAVSYKDRGPEAEIAGCVRRDGLVQSDFNPTEGIAYCWQRMSFLVSTITRTNPL